jgi:hypothetical protein
MSLKKQNIMLHFHQFLVSTLKQTKHKHQKTYTEVAVTDWTCEFHWEVTNIEF